MKVFAYLSLVLLLVACTGASSQNYPDWGAAVQQNRTLWESQQIMHYRMSVVPPYTSNSYYANSPMPLTVEVKDDIVISVVDANNKIVSPTSDADASYYQNFFTVPKLFSYITQYYLKKPPVMRVTFDQVLGYPDNIYIDPWIEPCCQDFTITVQDFEILP